MAVGRVRRLRHGNEGNEVVAADITLLALPATEDNWWRAQMSARLTEVEDPAFDRMALYREVAWLEIGPLSYLLAAEAIHDMWWSPRLVTPNLITQTMVAMNIHEPQRWPVPRRRVVKTWLQGNLGQIGWTENW